jgi:hypothetical protein
VRSSTTSDAIPVNDKIEASTDPAQIRPLVVGVETAVLLLDCNRDTIYKLLREKKLLSFLDGRRRKIFMSSIDTLIRERREAALREPFERHRYPRRRRSDK